MANRLLLVVVALALASCGVAEDLAGELTAIDPSEGPYARATVVGINYPPGAPQVGRDIGAFASDWMSLTERVDKLAPLVEDPEGTMWVAESDVSGIALDVVVDRDVIVLAQLQMIDAAGDGDEAAAAEVLDQFLSFLGVGDSSAALEQLGVVAADPLFAERAEILEIGDVTIYLASNEDTVLVGVTGAS